MKMGISVATKLTRTPRPNPIAATTSSRYAFPLRFSATTPVVVLSFLDLPPPATRRPPPPQAGKRAVTVPGAAKR